MTTCGRGLRHESGEPREEFWRRTANLSPRVCDPQSMKAKSKAMYTQSQVSEAQAAAVKALEHYWCAATEIPLSAAEVKPLIGNKPLVDDLGSLGTSRSMEAI